MPRSAAEMLLAAAAVAAAAAATGASGQSCAEDTFVVGNAGGTFLEATQTTLSACSGGIGRRPVEICATLAGKQERVANACPAGQFMSAVSASGVASCGEPDAGSFQRRITEACPVGSAVQSVGINGTVTCAPAPWLMAAGDAIFAPASNVGDVGIGVGGNPRGRLEVTGVSGTGLMSAAGGPNFASSGQDLTGNTAGVAGVARSGATAAAQTGVLGVAPAGSLGSGMVAIGPDGYTTYAGLTGRALHAATPTANQYANLATPNHGVDATSYAVRGVPVLHPVVSFRLDGTTTCLHGCTTSPMTFTLSTFMTTRTRITRTGGPTWITFGNPCTVQVTPTAGGMICNPILWNANQIDIQCLRILDNSGIETKATVTVMCPAP